MPTNQALSCDIFCTVIDNLGDAGVSWRLARQLATEYDWQVRLWIDDPAPIALFSPDHAAVPVTVHPWAGDFGGVTPAKIVIEAFACALPPRYVEAMAAMPRPPVWLNLEYLSAEDWVAGCHGLPSPHPPLTKHFFFPGFVAGTGGLLREKNLAVPHAGHFIPPLPKMGFPPVTPTFLGQLEISLFCYDNPVLPSLLAAWRDGRESITCHVADGLPRRQVEAWLGQPFPSGASIQRGRLKLVALPFLPQTEYDALLARCHLNFVRGEDSFVRAQWAERPFVWQAYPQADNAHLLKLDAFLNLYANVGDGNTAARNFFHAWNGNGQLNWTEFSGALAPLAAHAHAWAQQISTQGDLATNLVKFCVARL